MTNPGRSAVRRPPFATLRALLAALLLVTGAARGGGDHVRVVLDISKSMSTQLRDGSGPNDPGRLAVLAAQLLYDLVDPNPRDPTDPDSFQVLPFKSDWPHWTDPATPPPTGTGTPIVAVGQSLAERQAFWDRLRALAYDGDWTYFHPGLGAALESLDDPLIVDPERKLIVLVTDGLPEPEVREREAELLMALRERLIDAGVELYVLAFGPVADRERGFFERLFDGPRGAELGALFIDPTGRDLVLNMARIFSRSFGYQVQHLGPGGRERAIDLDGGITPPKVAVVALARGDSVAPAPRLEPPVSSVRGWVKAGEVGAAYSLLSVEGVEPRQHRLISDLDGADVAILRRVAPELTVLPGQVDHNGRQTPMRQARNVIAETPFTLRVQVASPTGISGDQADIAVGFRQHGPRAGTCAYAWSKDFQNADPGSRARFGPGVTYDIRMRFPANAEDPGSQYPGHVEVISKFQGEVVGRLDCDRAHRLTVFPRIDILPEPAAGFLSPRALGEGQTGRIAFTLVTDDPAKLDVLQTDRFGLRAEVEALDPSTARAALAGATMRLDGEPIGWVGADSPWMRGRELGREALLGAHELTIALEHQTLGRASGDLRLRLHLTLLHPPYDDFSAIAPFEAKLQVVPLLPPLQGLPSDAFWAFGLALLALAAALLLLARRYPLPRDLGYRLTAVPDDQGPLAADTLSARAFNRLALPSPRDWLGAPIRPPRPIRDPDTGLPICWIKPQDQGLYGIRLAAGGMVETFDGARVPMRRRLADILVHRTYRLRGPTGNWLLRVELSRDRHPGDADIADTKTHPR